MVVVLLWRDLLLWNLQLIAAAAATVAVIERRRRGRPSGIVVLLAHMVVPIAVVPLLVGRCVLFDTLLHR